MESISTDLSSRKRPAQEIEPLGNEDTTTGKRSCTDAPPSSAHLSLLEELCDFEENEAESCVDSVARDSSDQEDLVAEMMKSLEKVIEEGEGRGVGEASFRDAVCCPASPAPHTSTFDLAWASEEPLISEIPSFHGRLDDEEGFKEDAHIRHLLQASDDELGIPLSSSSSDLDESSFHEEWASLSEQSAPVSGMNWLDACFPQFEEASSFSRELFEPVILF
eukprot:c17870_g1_i1 orf=550-1212(+)